MGSFSFPIGFILNGIAEVFPSLAYWIYGFHFLFQLLEAFRNESGVFLVFITHTGFQFWENLVYGLLGFVEVYFEALHSVEIAVLLSFLAIG